MTTDALILCEGPHDAEFLASLLVVGASWRILRNGPSSTSNEGGGNWPKNALVVGLGAPATHRLVLVPMGGLSKLLGKAAVDLVRIHDNIACIGFVLDADEEGIGKRQAAVCDVWREAGKDLALQPKHGEVLEGQPGSALWVVGDQDGRGSLDDLILEAARGISLARVQLAEEFIENLAKLTGHEFAQYRAKACAGAIGQQFRAGGSLAAALQQREEWLVPDLFAQPRLAGLLEFLQRCVRR